MTPDGPAPQHLDYAPARIPRRQAPRLWDFVWLAVWGLLASAVIAGAWLLTAFALQMYFGRGD